MQSTSPFLKTSEFTLAVPVFIGCQKWKKPEVTYEQQNAFFTFFKLYVLKYIFTFSRESMKLVAICNFHEIVGTFLTTRKYSTSKVTVTVGMRSFLCSEHFEQTEQENNENAHRPEHVFSVPAK